MPRLALLELLVVALVASCSSYESSVRSNCPSSPVAERSRLVSIPDSKYVVSIPDAWTDHTVLAGEHSDVRAVNFPRDRDGGTLMFPQFEFRFWPSESSEERYRAISEWIAPNGINAYGVEALSIDGRRAKAFAFDSVRTMDFMTGGSESFPLSHRYILLDVDDGVVTCELTAGKETVEVCSTRLLEYCRSVVPNGNP